MKDSTEGFSSVILFCTTTAAFLWNQRKRCDRESRVKDSAINDNLFDSADGRSTPSDASDPCDPRNSVPPPDRGIINRLSFGCDIDVSGEDSTKIKSRTNTAGTIWNHFERFSEERDDGHHIFKSLEDKTLDRGGSIRSLGSTWDTKMEISPSSSFDSVNANVPIVDENQAFKSSQTNKCRLPNKLILVRHGQSEGNVNQKIYASKPDNSLNLTKLGWDQAKMAGKALKESIIGDNETIHFILSPYMRTMETFHGILSAWCDPVQFKHICDRDDRLLAWYSELNKLGITWSEDPRIREQDFGNYQDPAAIKLAKAERHNFGAFYYRFPHGESASDVFDRVSTFLDSLWRSFRSRKSTNYVIVTHGISIRVFLARYFRYTIDQFNLLENPKNAELVVLANDGAGKLKLSGRSQLIVEEHFDAETNTKKKTFTGYTFHKKLRCYPRNNVKKREVKLSYDI